MDSHSPSSSASSSSPMSFSSILEGSGSPVTVLPSLQSHLFQHRQFMEQEYQSHALPPLQSGSLSPSYPRDDVEMTSCTGLVRPPSRTESVSSSSEESTRPEPELKKKRPRFLGDIDRRIIIQRLQNGEKQADLAREFGVTRAAICHINKNREEILTRFDILAKSPQGRRMIENYMRSGQLAPNTHELQSASVSVLLTRLRDPNTTPFVYRSTADRLMSILLEEALVSFGTKNRNIIVDSSAAFEGKEYSQGVCALSLGTNGLPLLNLFHLMEPSAASGSIYMNEYTDNCGKAQYHLEWLELPQAVHDRSTLLVLTSCHNGPLICSAIAALLVRGIPQTSICIAALFSSTSAIQTIVEQYPEIKLLTAATVSSDNNAASGDQAVMMETETFLSRYQIPPSA